MEYINIATELAFNNLILLIISTLITPIKKMERKWIAQAISQI